MTLIHDYWLIIMSIIGSIVWFIRLEGRVGFQEKELSSLDAKLSSFDSKVLSKLSEIAERLSYIEGAIKGSQNERD